MYLMRIVKYSIVHCWGINYNEIDHDYKLFVGFSLGYLLAQLELQFPCAHQKNQRIEITGADFDEPKWS